MGSFQAKNGSTVPDRLIELHRLFEFARPVFRHRAYAFGRLHLPDTGLWEFASHIRAITVIGTTVRLVAPTVPTERDVSDPMALRSFAGHINGDKPCGSGGLRAANPIVRIGGVREHGPRKRVTAGGGGRGATADDRCWADVYRSHPQPWPSRMETPRQGRADGPRCRIEVFEPWVPALAGLAQYERVEVLYWLHLSRRDLVLQSPANDGTSRGTFSLRSPARPNPIGTAIAHLVGIEGAIVMVRGLDCLDGTPLLDLKPDRGLFTPIAPPQPGDLQVDDP